MQLSLNFGEAPSGGPDLLTLRDRLRARFGPFASDVRPEPLDQLVKSLISSRTHDEDSQATYDRLKVRYRRWDDLLAAPGEEVRALLAPVTYGESKADWLPAALKAIQRERGALSLDVLADWPVEAALKWLKDLDGVGPKVAAAVLNFSRLKRRVMVVDTHVHRVVRRYGLVPDHLTPEQTSRALMILAPDSWTAEDFYELHWLIKRLGQLRCTHGWARCGACPVAAVCERRDVPERSNVARLHIRTK